MNILDQHDSRLTTPRVPRTLWTAPDWQPPAVLRTPAERPAPLPRHDLKAPLHLSEADLARCACRVPGAADEVQSAPAPATPQAPTPPRRPGPRGTIAAAIEDWLRQAPPAGAYTAAEIADGMQWDIKRLRSHLSHAPQTMRGIEWRVIHCRGGRYAQYRYRRALKWPALPPDARAVRYSHTTPSVGGPRPAPERHP